MAMVSFPPDRLVTDDSGGCGPRFKSHDTPNRLRIVRDFEAIELERFDQIVRFALARVRELPRSDGFDPPNIGADLVFWEASQVFIAI